MEAMHADRDAALEERKTKQQAALGRLAAKRATLARQYKARLEEIGISAEVIEEQEDELAAVHEDANGATAAVEASLDEQEMEAIKVGDDALANAIVMADTEVERHSLQEQYCQAVAEDRQRLAASRAQELSVVSEKVALRRAALVKLHEDQLLDDVLEKISDTDMDKSKLEERLEEKKSGKVQKGADSSSRYEVKDDDLAETMLGMIVDHEAECSEVEVQAANGLAAQVLTDLKAAAAERYEKRDTAQKRLVGLYRSVAATEKAALVAAGASQAMVEEQVAETTTVDAEQAAQREEFETGISEKEEQQILAKQSQFEAAMDAGSFVEREKLAAAYAAEIEAVCVGIASERAVERGRLYTRLAKRKEMLADKQLKALQSATGDNTEVVTAVADAKTARAEAEALQLVWTIASPKLAAYLGNLMEGGDSDASGTDTRARKRVAVFEQLRHNRSALVEKHRVQLVQAGVPADVAESQISEVEVADSIADREVHELEDEEDLADNPKQRASKRAALGVELSKRRKSLAAQQQAKLGKLPGGVSPGGARPITHT
jgi:hypothetical protein